MRPLSRAEPGYWCDLLCLVGDGVKDSHPPAGDICDEGGLHVADIPDQGCRFVFPHRFHHALSEVEYPELLLTALPYLVISPFYLNNIAFLVMGEPDQVGDAVEWFSVFFTHQFRVRGDPSAEFSCNGA